jgi:tetratricopeptide (TPR) repeat protein
MLQLDEQYADGLHLLGLIAYRTRHYDAAVELIGRGIAIRGDQPIYHSNLGNVLRAIGRHDAAVERYRTAVALAPEFAEARCNLGFVLQLQGKLAEAVECFERALMLRPNQVEVWFGLGRALQDLGRLEEALARYERVVALQPQHAEAECQMGSILQLQERLAEATGRYERAIALKPTFAEAHYNLGHVFEMQGRFEESIASYERAVALKPEYANAAWNLTLVRLLRGDLRAGLAGYERRWGITVAPHDLRQPQWTGQPLHGARILLHAEQGLGDTLQFLRYVPMVQAAGGSVVLGVQASLRRIALEIPGVTQVVVHGEAMPEVEWQCPLLSLPLVLGTTLETIPGQTPYLSVPEQALAKAAAREWPETGLRVGLVWAGNGAHMRDRYRSMRLSEFASILQLEGIHFFSLQMGPEAEQSQHVTGAITDLGPVIEDMANTAALIANLDLVIAVDTSVAHMAGALGKPVWLLLPTWTDWRWLLDRADSPWYPEMRLFRQTTLGDWQPVVEQVRCALAEACERERGRVSPKS